MRWILLALAGLVSLLRTAQADMRADPGWTAAETWAWSQIAAGLPADFDVPCHASTAARSEDARTWSDPCRVVRSAVLEQILTRSPWRDAIPHQGLRMAGARVPGGLDLANAHVASAVILTRSRIEGDVLLARTRLDSLLALDGSVITGAVEGTALLSESDVSLSDGRQLVPAGGSTGGVEAHGSVSLRNARIKGSLFLNRSHFQQGMDIRGARIEEEIQTSGARFEADARNRSVLGGSMQIGGKLSINATQFAGDVLFPDTTTGGLVDASESRFGGKLSLVDSHVAGDVIVDAIQTAGGLSMSGLQVGGYISLAGAVSKGPIQAVNAHIAGDVSFNKDSHVEGPVTLAGAHVGGSLGMAHAPLAGPVNLRATAVAGDVQMEGADLKSGLDMLGLHVDGDLVLKGASIAGDLNAPDLVVDHDLVLNDGARFDGSVTIFDARVANTIQMEHASFVQGIHASNAHVAGDMLLDGSTFGAAVALGGARIGGSLRLAGASLRTLDLSGATIDGSLEVDPKTAWRQPASPDVPQLLLVNTKAGALQDGSVGKLDMCPDEEQPPVSNGWPTDGTIALDGFSYGHLGSSAGPEGADMRERDVCWWRWWLERDPTFSTQPYLQLASVMTAHGDQENAATILYFGRVRETQLAWQEGHYARWMLLAALNVVTGYGIGSYTFRVLGWIVALMVLGIVLLKRSPGGGQKPLLWRTGASLTRVLPGVEINKEFSDFFNDPERHRLKDWQVFVFSAFVIIGWVLGLFLVAAMTGLTQHS